ncbi:hypothetical protein HYQ40_06765 [Aerococcaceae bacterium DSM 111021]|nr:hypothetical protein [Aerococcaceae bacterium DSM 111021]
MNAKWKTAIVAIGFALICLSTTVDNNIPTIITGITFICSGWYLLKKDSKKSKNN